MLRRFLVAAGALTLALAPAGALAQDKGLTCMAGSYTPAQTAQLAELGARARFGDGSEANTAADGLGELAMEAVYACMERSGWNEEQALFAAFYELGRVNEAGFRASGQMSREDLAAIDRALASGDRTALWAGVERSLVGGISGVDAQPTASESIAMGAFIVGAGLGEDEAVNVGILLGFMGLQRVGQREFLALAN